MKISSVSAIEYGYPLSRPIGDVNLPQGADCAVDLAVFVHCDGGEVGQSIGHASGAPLIRRIAEVLVGSDPRSVQGLWDRMQALAFKDGAVGPVRAAIAALDCALWDLRAKVNGVPLWRELGATDRTVPAYASGLDMPLSDEELYSFYSRMAERGVCVGKLKVGRDPKDDARRIKVMLEALSSSGKLGRAIIDANEYWSPKQAVQRIAALEKEHELVWVEEPVRRSDYGGMKKVSCGIRAPVAAGENLNTPSDFVPLFVQDCADVIQLSSHVSGITGARIVAQMAATFDRPVTMNNDPGRAMAHLAAALRNHTMMEVLDAGRDVALVHHLDIEDGYIVLGDEPGSGIEFDMEFLSRHPGDGFRAGTLAARYARGDLAGLVG